MRRIQELLSGMEGDYIFPFFWQHGEDEATLREYMDAIYRSGIRSVCVECRPHPDFCGPKWWEDMDVILDEARTRGMHVWILDDDHFPTGHCNGAIAKADVSLRPWYVCQVFADAFGPVPANRFDVAAAMARASAPNPQAPGTLTGLTAIEKQHFENDERLLSVSAWRVGADGRLTDPVDVTDHVTDGVLTWDVPAGTWRICAVFTTHNGDGRPDYMNILDDDSVRVLIDAVYEPHYARYAEDFGKTIRGFFSDEPMVGNVAGMYQPGKLGTEKPVTNPWEKKLPGMMEERLGSGWKHELALLWQEGTEEKTTRVRQAYMDACTRRIEDSFAGQLGAWCEAHGVEYIGHIWEDGDLSYNFGGGLGHYFRAMHGNHMGGVDVVFSGSMRPYSYLNPKGGRSGDFYYHVLPKLASSFAHVDPKKQGRAMCEIFGATSWEFGLDQMKYIADNFLVGGVNRYVPHAFSPAPFPDPDCPPHFYAHGENAQFEGFGLLMGYMQRMCHLLDGGTAAPEAAVLYHAENEWPGDLTDVTHHMLCDTPARILGQHQIDYDILPADILAEDGTFADGALRIGNMSYQALIVPAADETSETLVQFAEAAEKAGFPVFFLGHRPHAWSADGKCLEPAGTLTGEEDLIRALRDCGIGEAVLSPASPAVKMLHYRQADGDLYMFVNNDAGVPYRGTVTLPQTGKAWVYDAFHNTVSEADQNVEGSVSRISVCIEGYRPLVLFFDHAAGRSYDTRAAQASAMTETARTVELTGFSVSSCEAPAYPAFSAPVRLERCEDLAVLHPEMLDFFRYETVFSMDEDGGRPMSAALELPYVSGCVKVWCNDVLCGEEICPPWRFDLSKAVRAGENRLRIEVASTPARKVKQRFHQPDISDFMGMPKTDRPEGIVGPVRLNV